MQNIDDHEPGQSIEASGQVTSAAKQPHPASDEAAPSDGAEDSKGIHFGESQDDAVKPVKTVCTYFLRYKTVLTAS